LFKIFFKKNRYVFFLEEAFSLVELMVVVAIIGILTSIAVPSYQKYQSRARQVEAKANLANIYTAENSFSVDQSTFSFCLANIGYAPTNPAAMYYAVGFSAMVTIPTTCGPSGTNSCAAFSGYTTSTPLTCIIANGVTYWNASLRMNAPTTPAATGTTIMPLSTVANATNFVAGAAGNISRNSGYDFWSIDSSNTMMNNASGI
jgi:type IV pilus assembly protein PilA